MIASRTRTRTRFKTSASRNIKESVHNANVQLETGVKWLDLGEPLFDDGAAAFACTRPDPTVFASPSSL